MNYQPEERYWTDYLRIALPILGLLLLLGVFWYWASSFIGDDDNTPPATLVAEVATTPISAPSPTATVGQAIVITPQTIDPTQAAEAQAPPTATLDPGDQAPPPSLTPELQPTQPVASDSTKFAVDEIAVVNDNEVNMRSEPSTEGDVVDVLALGTELRILSIESVLSADRTWWNVEDTANGTQGWVAEEFMEKQS